MTAGRIPSVEGGIQPTLLTTKGDIIAATAASTVSRLAVGADYAFLSADSIAQTGLAWDGAAWTTYTPTVTSGGGSFTTVSALGGYKRIGKVCVTRIQITMTAIGTATGIVDVTLPFTAKTGFDQMGVAREVAIDGSLGACFVFGGDNFARVGKYNNTALIGNGFVVPCQLTFEVA